MYEELNGSTFRTNKEGERDLLANFVARITAETRIVDDANSQTILTIQGTQAGDRQLPPVDVPAANWASLGWVMSAWGTRAVIQPGNSIKDDLRAAIQLASRPEMRTIYMHTGWTDRDGTPTYLHAAGGIGPNGNDPTINVSLPMELSRYDLTPAGDDVGAAVKATLDLTTIGPAETTWPLLAATLAPIHGPVDYAVHVTGRTGTFKSELMSLFQSHYGTQMDARHLPASWSSTANALEAQAYRLKNAPMVLDDFVPTGTSWQVRAYQKTADQIIRAQGNQAGRARLTDASRLQETMYPRGIILSTGEDTPEGHSVRARMMIIELTPGDIEPAALSQAQRNRPKYTTTTAAYIQDVAKNPRSIKDQADKIRNANLDVGHTRTPPMLGSMLATIQDFLTWASQSGYITKTKATQHMNAAKAGITRAATTQKQYLETADPCEAFLDGLRQMLQGHTGHLRTMTGGIPADAVNLGWTEESSQGELPNYKSHGKCLGWVLRRTDEIFLDADLAYIAIKKHMGSAIPLGKHTLWKRMRDAGMLTKTDDVRQRNVVRIKPEGGTRNAIALSYSSVFSVNEVPQDGTQEDDDNTDDSKDGSEFE